jgi:hypothetical protein
VHRIPADSDRKEERRGGTVRIAAAGDIHAREGMEEQLRASFQSVRDKADLVLLAGDLTTHGAPREADISPAPAGIWVCL